MAIVISIHQVADKSVTWKQAAQATQFGAIWLQLIGQEVWQKLSYLFDQLPRLHKSLGNPTDLVCSRNDYILWYKFQKFKKCKNISGYALMLMPNWNFFKNSEKNWYQALKNIVPDVSWTNLGLFSNKQVFCHIDFILSSIHPD